MHYTDNAEFWFSDYGVTVKEYNMQILINIRDDYFEALKKSYLVRGSRNNGKLMIYSICDAIINGVQIPKDYGRLKDIDAFIAKVKADREHACYVRSWTADDVLEALDKSYAPTIIEAESEEK